MSTWIAEHRKFLAAVAGMVAVIAAEIPPDAPGWLTGACAAVSAVAVMWVRNQPQPDKQPAVVHTEEAGYPRTQEEQAEQLQQHPRVDRHGIDREPPRF